MIGDRTIDTEDRSPEYLASLGDARDRIAESERREQATREAAYKRELAESAARQAAEDAAIAARLAAEEANPLISALEHILSALRGTRDFSASTTSTTSRAVRDAERCLNLLRQQPR